MINANEIGLDNEVAKHLEYLSNAIAETFRDTEAIILSGSFGKGEGSNLWLSNRSISLSDYDLMVITKNPRFPPNIPSYKNVEFDNLAKRIGVNLTITVVWKSLLRFVPRRIEWFDIKFGSKILYGDPKVLNLIPFDRKDPILISDGLRLLTNRTLELLQYFDPNLSTKNINPELKDILVYRCIKAILGCCESLLVLRGKWDPSLKRRCSIFTAEYSKEFSRLAVLLPDLPSAVIQATEFKLLPPREGFINDFEDYWRKTTLFTTNTIRYYWQEWESRQVTDQQMINDLLRSNRASMFDYIHYNISFLKYKHKICPQAISLARKNIPFLILAIAYLLLFSLQENGLDKSRIQMAKAILAKMYPLEASTVRTSEQKWRFVRDNLFEMLSYTTH